MDADRIDNDGKWLTFIELSQARGISLPSARKLVRRHKWRRQAGNDGVVRILVPSDALDRPTPDPGADLDTASRTDPGPDCSPDPGTGSWDISSVFSTLQTAVASLTERAESAEKRADRAETRAEMAEARANRAEQALSAEQNRAFRAEARADQAEISLDKMETELEAAKIAQAKAEADASELRQNEAEWRGQGRWTRLRAAWRRK
jgi:hypothetical protein